MSTAASSKAMTGRHRREQVEREAGRSAIDNYRATHPADTATQRVPSGSYAPQIALTEDALALHFVQINKDELRYLHDWQAYVNWDGVRWKRDTTGVTPSRVREFLRQQNLLRLPRWSSAAAVRSILSLAKDDQRIACLSTQFDCEQFLLATPGGTVDLRTGKLRESSPEDSLIRLAGATPDFDANCPRWIEFLTQSAMNDEGLIEYLQRLAGYCLTASTVHHELYFLYGAGGNGKSVYTTILAALLGEYAQRVAAEVFMAATSDRHPTDIAALQGARGIFGSEVPEDRAWNESRLKDFSGGDSITARVMYGNPFMFTPVGKLLFSGNHKPVLRSVSEAMRRRFRLVPFRFQVPEAKIDPLLVERLRDELPAIMAWAVRGAQKVIATGIPAPMVVTEATAEYFRDADPIGQWIDACCTLDPAFMTPAALARDSFDKYAEAAGLGRVNMTKAAFRDQLRARGVIDRRTKQYTVYHGIGIREVDDAE